MILLALPILLLLCKSKDLVYFLVKFPMHIIVQPHYEQLLLNISELFVEYFSNNCHFVLELAQTN